MAVGRGGGRAVPLEVSCGPCTCTHFMHVTCQPPFRPPPLPLPAAPPSRQTGWRCGQSRVSAAACRAVQAAPAAGPAPHPPAAPWPHQTPGQAGRGGGRVRALQRAMVPWFCYACYRSDSLAANSCVCHHHHTATAAAATTSMDQQHHPPVPAWGSLVAVCWPAGAAAASAPPACWRGPQTGCGHEGAGWGCGGDRGRGRPEGRVR